MLLLIYTFKTSFDFLKEKSLQLSAYLSFEEDFSNFWLLVCLYVHFYLNVGTFLIISLQFVQTPFHWVYFFFFWSCKNPFHCWLQIKWLIRESIWFYSCLKIISLFLSIHFVDYYANMGNVLRTGINDTVQPVNQSPCSQLVWFILHGCVQKTSQGATVLK